MVGSWPPVPGISAYCFELAHAVGAIAPIEFLTFSRMYPDFLYPGGRVPRDDSFPSADPGRVRLHRSLVWYNPLGWVSWALASRADLLHVQFWSLPLAPVLATLMAGHRSRGKPCLLTVHNLSDHERRPAFEAALRTLVGLASGIVLHAGDDSHWIAERCRRKGKPVWRLPHGALELYRDAPMEKEAARAELGLPPGGPVVLFFGAIRKYKGLDVLLEAFADVRARVPGANLVVAGRLWEPWGRYAERIDRLGLGPSLRLFLDYVPTNRVKLFFSAADLVALPYEGFLSQSGVGAAAAAFRTPVVVSDLPGLATVQPDARFRTPPGDAKALADAIVRALADDDARRSLTAECERIAARLSWSEVADLTTRCYQSLLSGRPCETSNE